MLQNVGIWGVVLSWNVVFAKIVLVDNLFTLWALAENIFPAIPRHVYTFIFKSSRSTCSLYNNVLQTFKKRGPGVIPQTVFY